MKDIIVTGAFGLVGSAIVKKLNERGIMPKVIDRWDNPDKWRNIKGLRFKKIEVEDIYQMDNPTIVHCAASVDTKEVMSEALWKNNVTITLELRRIAGKFIYMSSMSVYGNSSDMTERLDVTPLCAYALTKAHLDQMLFGGEKVEPNTYALRLSNVYGPREQHKGDMASLVTKGLLKQSPLYCAKGNYVNQEGPISKTHWRLFESPVKNHIVRDFVFVEDVAGVVLHFIDNDLIPSGIFNLGNGGEPRSFEDLVTAVEKRPIKYVVMPENLRSQYQYKTEVPINKLLKVAGYKSEFASLEEGVEKTRAWMKQEGLIP